jgi:hypothetical protein
MIGIQWSRQISRFGMVEQSPKAGTSFADRHTKRQTFLKAVND